MKMYLLSLGAGILAGVIYGLLDVRSPVPPVIGLVGIAGILIGEQVIPVAKRAFGGCTLAAAWQKAKCSSHVFGRLPSRGEG